MPADALGAIELNPAVAFAMIDRILGGSGETGAPQRALTEIEQNVVDSVIKLRKYFKTITIPAHRKALTDLLFSNHTLAIEQLRRVKKSDGSRFEANERLCRFCGHEVETEVHALFMCDGVEVLVERRDSFFEKVDGFRATVKSGRCKTDPSSSIHFFLEHDDLAPIFAKFVYDVLRIFGDAGRK